MLIPMGDLLKESVQKRYGVGAFACLDLITTMSTIRVAEEKNLPLIMLCEVCRQETPRDLELYYAAVNSMAQMARVPVATILDHGPDFETCMQAIRYGFSTVMFDGSALSLKENIYQTKKVVEAAHACGVQVEAEIGHVGGEEGEVDECGSEVDTSKYTDPEEAKYFAEETGVDALAIAVGTVHGAFKAEPNLDMERIAKIRQLCPDLALVLHGGSGVPDEQFQEAIRKGINKINIYTSVATATANACRDFCDSKNGKTVVFDDLVLESVAAIKKVTARHMDVFMTQPLRRVY